MQVDQGLKLVQTPYLPPVSGSKKYTLVLDLDETLLHFEEVSIIKVIIFKIHFGLYI